MSVAAHLLFYYYYFLFLPVFVMNSLLFYATCLNSTFSPPGHLLNLSEMYQFSVSEGAAVGTPVGRVIATDADMGENTDMSYLIKEGGELFKVTTDVKTQEAVVSIKKVHLNISNITVLFFFFSGYQSYVFFVIFFYRNTQYWQYLFSQT